MAGLLATRWFTGLSQGASVILPHSLAGFGRSGKIPSAARALRATAALASAERRQRERSTADRSRWPNNSPSRRGLSGPVIFNMNEFVYVD